MTGDCWRRRKDEGRRSRERVSAGGCMPPALPDASVEPVLVVILGHVDLAADYLLLQVLNSGLHVVR